MKIRLFHPLASLCVLALFAAAPPVARGQEVLDGIAAVVNNDVITFRQVREMVGPKEQAAHQQLKGEALNEKVKEIRLQAVNDLIDRQLILQEFKSMQSKGASIPDHVLDEHISTIIREEFGNDRSAFIRTLAADGLTLDKFRQMELDKIIVQAMRSQLVKPNVIVPEPKIEEFYKKNIEQFSSEEQIHLRLLLIKGKDQDGNDRRKTIEEIRQKIAGGAAFEDLARLYSDDSATQDSGGDMGWINRRVLSESLSKSAFSLKPGEMSKIIELGGNYYLLFCEARKPQITKSLAQVHDDIEKALIQSERQKAQEEWVAKLRKKAFIKIY